MVQKAESKNPRVANCHTKKNPPGQSTIIPFTRIPESRLNLTQIRKNRVRVRTPSKSTGDPQDRKRRTTGRNRRARALPTEMMPRPQDGRISRTPRTQRAEGLTIPGIKPSRTDGTTNRDRTTSPRRVRQGPDRRPIDLTQRRRLDVSRGRHLMTGRLKELIPAIKPPPFTDEMTHLKKLYQRTPRTPPPQECLDAPRPKAAPQPTYGKKTSDGERQPDSQTDKTKKPDHSITALQLQHYSYSHN